jgi:hypothetical protein
MMQIKSNEFCLFSTELDEDKDICEKISLISEIELKGKLWIIC